MTPAGAADTQDMALIESRPSRLSTPLARGLTGTDAGTVVRDAQAGAFAQRRGRA